MQASRQGARKKAAVVDSLLVKSYRDDKVVPKDDPLDTLVETILSQNTTDLNSHRSYLALKKQYPTWESMEREDPAKIAKIIRSGGLAEIKANRILDALEYIRSERGNLGLDFLRQMTPFQADRWLAGMKGVGPKTRAIVLLFSLDMPAFPVDTHVHRVSRRLGLISEKTSRESAQEELADIVPLRRFYPFHINLIEHGRAVCRSQKPRCEACQISHLCDDYQSRHGA